MGFHNPRMPWSELESTLSGRTIGTQQDLPYTVDPLAVDADGGDAPAWSRKRQPYAAPALIRPTDTVPYAELHCHTNFSFLDGASHPEDLAADLGTDVVVLTGCRKGTVPRALATGGMPAAARELDRLVDLFGASNVAVELTSSGDPYDDERNDALN